MVRMTEDPDGLTALLAFNPLVHVFTMGRNEESLMRLEELALLEAAGGGHGPHRRVTGHRPPSRERRGRRAGIGLGRDRPGAAGPSPAPQGRSR